MTTTDLNVLYNARIVIPNHAQYSDAWIERAAAFREQASGELDIPYGSGEREKFDLFAAADPDAAVCIYIHGGYWRSRDRKVFSHVARPLVERGISVVVPSYDLAPTVTIPQIIDQIRACVMKVWEMTNRRPVVTGHSAGGHLASAMLATDWAGIEGAPDDLVTSAFALSGLFDLRPLIELDINDEIGMVAEDAAAASTLLWSAPRNDLTFVAAVGADETPPFLDQSRTLADAWRGNGIATEFIEVPDSNHFTVLDNTFDGESQTFQRLMAMIEAHASA